MSEPVSSVNLPPRISGAYMKHFRAESAVPAARLPAPRVVSPNVEGRKAMYSTGAKLATPDHGPQVHAHGEYKYCRIAPYMIKATALRAAAPGRGRGGRAAWRPVPPRLAGQDGVARPCPTR